MSKNNFIGKEMLAMVSEFMKKNGREKDLTIYSDIVNSLLTESEGIVSEDDVVFLKHCVVYLSESEALDMEMNKRIISLRNKYFYPKRNIDLSLQECKETNVLKMNILRLLKGYFKKAAAEFVREINGGSTNFLKVQTDYLRSLNLNEEVSYFEFYHLFRKDGSSSPMFREFSRLIGYMTILEKAKSINDVDFSKAKEIIEFRNKHIIYL